MKRGQRDLFRKVAMAGIALCMIVVAVDFLVVGLDSPKRIAERKLAMIAKDYYENYFYERFVGERDPATTLKPYARMGFQKVYLRQLLLFDNQRHQSARKWFEEYKCDTNTTAATYYPEEPFGRGDYRVEYTLVCEE